MSKFAPQTSFTSTGGGAKSWMLKRVASVSSSSGADFKANITFNASLGSNEFVDLSRSYLSIRSKWSKYTPGTPPTLDAAGFTGADVAPARWCWANAFSQIETSFSGTSVETTDHVAHSSLIHYNLTKSSEWAETEGSVFCGNASRSDRAKNIIGNRTRDINMQIPQGIWHTGQLLRGLNLQLNMQVDPQWYRRVVESANNLVHLSSGATGNYDITIEDVVLNLSVWSPEDSLPGAMTPCNDIIDAQSIQIHKKGVSSDGASFNFVVQPSTYMSSVFFQRPTTGSDTRYPPTLVEAGDLRDEADAAVAAEEAGIANVQYIRTHWRGAVHPSNLPDLNFATGKDLFKVYNENFLEPGIGHAAGRLLSVEGWAQNPIYTTRLIGSTESTSTDLQVDLQFKAAAGTGNTYTDFVGSAVIGAIYPRRIILQYNSEGLVREVHVAKNDKDLASITRIIASSV